MQVLELTSITSLLVHFEVFSTVIITSILTVKVESIVDEYVWRRCGTQSEFSEGLLRNTTHQPKPSVLLS